MKSNAFLITTFSLTLLCAYGWVMNIVSLVNAAAFGGMEIARVAGIFVAPLGVVLGFI